MRAKGPRRGAQFAWSKFPERKGQWRGGEGAREMGEWRWNNRYITGGQEGERERERERERATGLPLITPLRSVRRCLQPLRADRRTDGGRRRSEISLSKGD